MSDFQSSEILFSKYKEAYLASDVNAMLELLSDDFVFSDDKESFSLNKNQYAPILYWDSIMKIETKLEKVKFFEDSVSCRLLERNVFYNAIGLEDQQFDLTFYFRKGKIIRQTFTEINGYFNSEFNKKFGPLDDWVRSNYPMKYDIIIVNGQPVISLESALIWQDLLEDWNNK